LLLLLKFEKDPGATDNSTETGLSAEVKQWFTRKP
jgi:hypothetical protein